MEPIETNVNSIYCSFLLRVDLPLRRSLMSERVVPIRMKTIEPGMTPTKLKQKSLKLMADIPTQKLRTLKGTIGLI